MTTAQNAFSNRPSNWNRKPQEQEGNYFFSGKFFMTKTVQKQLSTMEILNILREVRILVREQNGLDYLQIFENENGDKLFLIDQISKSMIESNQFSPGDNYCTLLFSYEY